MEKQMRYVLMLSLQEMSLRKIAVSLWRKPDVLALICKFPLRNGNYHKEWRETVECKVIDELSKLQLPEVISKQMIRVLKPIGSQSLKWKFFHESFLTDSTEGLDAHILEKLCWTCTGTIDYRKTAEALIHSDAVDVVKRYQLACLYCLEQYVPVFWKKLSRKSKKYFYKGESAAELPYLWFCWPLCLKGEENKLCRSWGYQFTFYQYAFKCSAVRGNTAATQYFLQKLTHEEREFSVTRAVRDIMFRGSVDYHIYPNVFPNEKVTDVLCYLLSLLTAEQQMEVFRENPLGFVKCFLVWPWQDLFSDNANVMWSLLHEREYNSIWTVTKCIQNSNFPEKFRDFFLLSPGHLRKYFIDVDNHPGVYFSAFFAFDTETIKLILRNVDAADRVRLMTSKPAVQHYLKLVLKGRWEVLEVCIRESKLSREDRERVRLTLVRSLGGTRRESVGFWNPNFKRFFRFLDDPDAAVPSKRNLYAETLAEAKKLRR